MNRDLQLAGAPLLVATAISKDYVVRKPFSGRRTVVHALSGVDLTVARGTTLAIVGESGAGKSTLARCIAGLEQPDAGEILFCGRPIPLPHSRESREFHRQVQLVLQDSATALNARFTAVEVVSEPLVILHIGNERERQERVVALLNDVGLSSDLTTRSPRQLSGGQRQRLAIARALALHPHLLVFDEAFSGLDMRVQKQIAILLRELQRRQGLTLLFISHDLALMAAVASEIAIMYRGKIVERGLTAEVLRAPSHPHTRALVASVPGIERRNAVAGAKP